MKSHTLLHGRRSDYEREEHIVVAQWLDLHGIKWFHTPNGGGRHPAEAARMRAMGVKRGVPDFLIIDPPPKALAHGAALELKRRTSHGERRAALTPEQREWLEALKERGWAARVSHGAKDAIGWLEHLGYGMRGRTTERTTTMAARAADLSIRSAADE